MSWLYEFLEKKQIIYDEIDTEEWDGVLLIEKIGENIINKLYILIYFV